MTSSTPEERAARRAYYYKTHAKQLEYKRRHRAKPGVREKEREQSRRYEAKRKTYRPGDYLADLEVRAGRRRPDRCEVCGRTSKRICFDHDHQRGHFRAWLCVNCNLTLGYVHDDPQILLMLVAYLQRSRENTSPQLTLPGI